MKTTEEKAKAYDEALIKVKELLDSPRACFNIVQLKDIFPELRESEDERIIEEIKFAIMQMPSEREDTKQRCLAWLEKQKEYDFVYETDSYNSAQEDAWKEYCSKSSDKQDKPTFFGGFMAGYLFGIHEEKPLRWTSHDEAVRKEAITCLESWNESIKSYRVDYDNILSWLKDRLSIHSNLEKQKEQKPIEFKNDELVEIIKGEFEGFRNLLKKKGIDYEPQRGYWEGFARLFDSSAREYVKEQKEQRPERINVTEKEQPFKVGDKVIIVEDRKVYKRGIIEKIGTNKNGTPRVIVNTETGSSWIGHPDLLVFDTTQEQPVCEDLKKRASEIYPNKEGDLCSLHSTLQRGGYIRGYQDCKEQMMKEAVEGKIIFLLNGDVAVNIGDTDGYKLGQKGRIIIVKEDKK